MSGWWWTRPEFVEAQRDPGFIAWVEATESALELEGFDDLVPALRDLPQEMYNEDCLIYAERRFLELFPDAASLDAAEATATRFRFIGFIGHMYVHKLECRWVFQPKAEKYGWNEGGPAIEQPWDSTSLFEVMAAPRVAAHRRQGTYWDRIFKNNQKRYLEWVERGRPEPA